MHQLEMSHGVLGAGIYSMQGSYGFKARGHKFIGAFQSLQYGAFNGTDLWGNSTNTFYAGDMAFSIGTELYRWNNVRIGATVKGVVGTYESYQSWAVATDLVAMYKGEQTPDIALLIRNAGTQLTTFGGQREALPLNLTLAIGDKLAHAPVRWALVLDQLNRPNLGYDDPNLQTIDPITGEVLQGQQSLLNLAVRHLGGSLELMPTDRVHLMMGYSFRRQFEMALADRRTSGGFTLGTGLYFNAFQVHYAYELRSVAGRMNTLSLSLQI